MQHDATWIQLMMTVGKVAILPEFTDLALHKVSAQLGLIFMRHVKTCFSITNATICSSLDALLAH